MNKKRKYWIAVLLLICMCIPMNKVHAKEIKTITASRDWEGCKVIGNGEYYIKHSGDLHGYIKFKVPSNGNYTFKLSNARINGKKSSQAECSMGITLCEDSGSYYSPYEIEGKSVAINSSYDSNKNTSGNITMKKLKKNDIIYLRVGVTDGIVKSTLKISGGSGNKKEDTKETKTTKKDKIKTIKAVSDWESTKSVTTGTTYINVGKYSTRYIAFKATKDGSYTFSIKNARAVGKKSEDEEGTIILKTGTANKYGYSLDIRKDKNSDEIFRGICSSKGDMLEYPTSNSLKVSMKKGNTIYLLFYASADEDFVCTLNVKYSK